MAKGFNRPMGGGGNQMGMMQQIKKMQEQMAAAQSELALETVTSSAGGGAIKITMTGDQHCTAVQIDREMLIEADNEMLQDLILSAINLSLDDSRELQNKKLGPMASSIPGLSF